MCVCIEQPSVEILKVYYLPNIQMIFAQAKPLPGLLADSSPTSTPTCVFPNCQLVSVPTSQ